MEQLVYITAAITMTITWFVMLKKHKYQNILQLIGIAIAAMVCITAAIVRSEETAQLLSLACAFFGLGFVFEEVRIFRKDWLFVRNKNITIIKYEDLEKKDNFIIANVISNKKTYQNGVSLALVGKFFSTSKSETYISDFDNLVTVVSGKMTIFLPDKTVVLTEGKSFKIPSYCPRSIKGSINTTINITAFKVSH